MHVDKSIIITVPYLRDQGGVASFYNSVLPYYPDKNTRILEIGGSRRFGGMFYPLMDQLRFRRTIYNQCRGLIHINPSLDAKCFLRDGLFAWQTKCAGLPLLVFWHGWEREFAQRVEKKYLWYFRRTFGRADGFIVLASEFEQTLRDWGVTVPVYLETTCVGENLVTGFDVQGKWPEAPTAAGKTIKILFLARLERAKGVFETIQAINLLLKKQYPVCLTIAGDGAIRQELEQFTRSLGLTAKQVHFTGDVRGREKIQALTDHHLYCFPTYYGEGMPTSVLEAMAFAMPVVTRPVGGLADMFADGKMGSLVQGKSPEEIAACLEKLIRRPEQMAEIGRYNAEYAREHFMASKVAARLQKIYNEVMAGCIQ